MKVQRHFSNKLVWLTGASSGIGEQLAYQLNDIGAILILSARRLSDLEKVRSQCSYPERVKLLPIDLTDEWEVKAKAELAAGLYGQIDILIHNAGVSTKDLASKTSMEVNRRVMETNFFGPVALTKSVLPGMIERKVGQIVVVSSLSGKYGVPKLSGYAASKHALHGYFESLRTEVAGHGISINFIVPGFIKTKIIEKALTGDGHSYQKQDRTSSRGMSAEKCADRMIRAISKKKNESAIGGMETFSLWLNRFFPSLNARIMRNHPLKRWENFIRKLSLNPKS